MPSKEAFQTIGQRLYPEEPEIEAYFSSRISVKAWMSDEFAKADLHLAMEGSDLDVLNWLRAHDGTGTNTTSSQLCTLFLPIC